MIVLKEHLKTIEAIHIEANNFTRSSPRKRGVFAWQRILNGNISQLLLSICLVFSSKRRNWWSAIAISIYRPIMHNFCWFIFPPFQALRLCSYLATLSPIGCYNNIRCSLLFVVLWNSYRLQKSRSYAQYRTNSLVYTFNTHHRAASLETQPHILFLTYQELDTRSQCMQYPWINTKAKPNIQTYNYFPSFDGRKPPPPIHSPYISSIRLKP